VISQGKQDKQPTARTLSHRAIVLGAVFVLGIAVTSGTVLWCLYHDADPCVQLDAIRTASAITVVVGGAVALLLAARRQQSTEQTLEHERENAAEQRITELYTRAVDQLGARGRPRSGSAVCTRWSGWRRTTPPSGKPYRIIDHFQVSSASSPEADQVVGV
jgi:hypothetical protein